MWLQGNFRMMHKGERVEDARRFVKIIEVWRTGGRRRRARRVASATPSTLSRSSHAARRVASPSGDVVRGARVMRE